MIRRDYILRMIEQFIQALARIKSLRQGQHWQEAAESLDLEFQQLVGAGPAAVAALSETELLAKLIAGEPTQAVHDKTLMLAALLKEAGDLAAASDQPEQSRGCYLKGLHLLLGTLSRGEVFEWPAFVPQVEVFVAALSGGAPLPLATSAMLMQHYERTGEFGKAEDALFAMLEAQPENPDVKEFGLAFYRRLQAQSDSTLEQGNLPRAELEAGLAQIR
jgi:hypothetical protein